MAFYARRLAAPPFLRAAVVLLVLVNPWAPQILALMGLFDIWLDLRKYAEPPAGTPPDSWRNVVEVILREDVNNLGRRGDIVKVAEGYGRNFLLPRGKAVAVNAANKAMVEKEKKAAAGPRRQGEGARPRTWPSASPPCASWLRARWARTSSSTAPSPRATWPTS